MRCDDKFIKEKIGIIPKSWNYQLTLDTDENELWVKFPNGHHHSFDLNKTTADKIKKYYEEL